MPLLSTSTPKDAETGPEDAEHTPVPVAPSGSLLRRRRRPALIALGIALIVVCGLGTYWVVDRLSTTSQVVVAAADVPEGQVLSADDLTTTEVNVPAGTSVVSGSDLESLVGQRAASPLHEGALLSPGQVSEENFPAPGTAVVGIRVTAGQIPANDVEPGDSVQIVGTPREGDDPPTGDAPVVNGTVHAVASPTSEGVIVVDVLVEEERAATLTSLSATGRIGVVLLPEEQ
ncbi:SAF domain-containing protein [Brachybacterium sacelli]|uniref:SAF domain-containing protein n=1 Tax=Brachybacterium sacelli TaxID=173364 RepID=A0ABS4WWV0_9MICO|nr:SAF domain-containing protein [Brachybacterium sacelli]MBP2380668.1 hypothetical protein [Brachybacterium sacelli]